MFIWTFFLFSLSRKLVPYIFLYAQFDNFFLGFVSRQAYSMINTIGLVYFVYVVVIVIKEHMAALRTAPDDALTSESGSFPLKNEESLSWVATSLCGWRPQMEDAHVVCEVEDGFVFAVFDGHGGAEVSRMAAKILPSMLHRYQHLPAKERLEEVIIQLDEALWRGPFPMKVPVFLHPYADMGSTCILCHIDDNRKTATVASTGDSRCILSRNKQPIALSQDHKPEDVEERTRIENCGGRVIPCGPCWRVDGDLNLSRALGDFIWKGDKRFPADKQRIICQPAVEETSLEADDDFLVVACDGLFEKFTRKQLVDVLHEFREDKVGEKQSWRDRAIEATIRAMAWKPGELGTDNETLVLITWDK